MHKRLVIDPNIKQEAIATSPIIIRVTDFTEESVKEFSTSFQSALNTGQEIIPIVIDSYGGEAYSVIAMIEIVKAAQENGIIVATYVGSKAMSCGAILFSCGNEGYRFVSPFAHIMMHQVSGAAWGTVERIEVSTKQTRRLNDRLMEMVAKNTGHKKSYWLDRIKENGNANIYLDAKEAVDCNLANEVRTPTFEIRVKQSVAIV